MTRFLARWRVALRIARRDATRHRGRTALVVAMIALPLVAATLLLTVVRSGTPTPQTTVAAELGPAAQARVEFSGCGPVDQDLTGNSLACLGDGDEQSTPLDPGSLRSVLGAERAIAVPEVGVALVSQDAALNGWGLTEVENPADLALIVETVQGRLPQTTSEVAMSPGTARRLVVTVGDDVRLASSSGQEVVVQVVGLLDPRSRYDLVAPTGTAPSGPAPAGTLQASAGGADPAWVVLGDEPVTWEQVMAANAQGWKVLSRAVVQDPPPTQEIPYAQYAPDDGQRDARTTGLVGVVAAMALIEIGLLIGPAFAIGARRSARQLAVVAAAGGAPADLRRVVLASGVVCGTLGAAIGIGLGLLGGAAAFVISNRFLDGGLPNLLLPTWELVALAALALMIGVGAAWLPARAAARSDVVAALAGRRGDPRPTRGVAKLGIGLAVLGVLIMVLAAVSGAPAGLVAGVVAVEVGVVLTSGTIVVAVARLAPRLGAAGRFALRDSVRHRSRTAPAVAAVLAAVAAAAAGSVYLQGEFTANRASWVHVSEEPGLSLTWIGEDLTGSQTAVSQALATIGEQIDVQAAAPIQVAAHLPDVDDEQNRPMLTDVSQTQVDALVDPNLSCTGEPTESADPRCAPGPNHPLVSRSWTGILIDDGTVVGASGLPSSQEAAATLAAGGVVTDVFATWSDGTAHLHPGGPEQDDLDTLVAPAHGTTWYVTMYQLVLSPQAAEQLDLEPVTVGGLITTARELNQDEVDRLNAVVRDVSPYLSLAADRPRPVGVPISLVMLGVATLVALIAIGLAVGLAGAETRPDMATLAAIGAPPRIRRRVAAAQAGVIAGTGSVLGVLTGIPIGLVLSLWGREQTGYGDLWPLSVPWQVPLMALTIPLVAMAAAWLLTRSRLPLTQRLSS